MSGAAMQTPATLPQVNRSAPELQPADTTQDAVNRALEGARHLIEEMRSAKFAALTRHAQDVRT